jgi:DNA polymerase-1
VPTTAKGNASVNKEWFANHDHPLANKIEDIRSINRLRQTYLEDMILKPNRSIILPEFIQIAREEGGTRTGRLSCRNPNLQQVPVRNKAINAQLLRTLFVAPDGYQWAKADYSSQEPRLQIHYALLADLPGAKEAAAVFASGQKLYHYIEKHAGICYDDAKAVMLARSYSMGVASFARKYHKTKDEAEEILVQFDELCPYIGILAGRVRDKADERGYVKTLSGRRRHFDWWEVDRWDRDGVDADAVGYSNAVFGLEAAQARWPNNKIVRAYTNKAFNALIQGGSADMAKKAMIALHRAGIQVVLQVHDELNSLVRSQKEAQEMKELMEHVYDLRIPIIADLKVGACWC